MNNVQPYLTAEQLGIEDWEHAGLVALVGPLSRGDLQLHMVPTVSACGTAACIGGWVAINHGIQWNPKADHPGWDITKYVMTASGRQLEALYYPHNTGGFEANAEQAAIAITNFLMTGDPMWSDVMATP